MLDALHPLVREWFVSTFAAMTEPQGRGWPIIRAGGDALISAPTGSGKTLAAFTLALDDLVAQANAGTLPDRTLVVYVSPLKALTNDVRENLEKPLAAIVSRANRYLTPMMPIRTAVRTGDTTPAQRQRMLREPPHVLVTT
ncbi:MAG: DEAD/DEAH box helicase, partial [Candidatus Eremiobacteraeota bacterium]|nr:DEAD/DEAH box helicase [Candidatus Eremiobacteraeota bacterium]